MFTATHFSLRFRFGVVRSAASHRFDLQWESMKRSPSMRNLGAALLAMAAAFLILTPLIPKVSM